MRSNVPTSLRRGLIVVLATLSAACTFPAETGEFPSLDAMATDEVLQLDVPSTSSSEVGTMNGSSFSNFAARAWREWADVSEEDAFEAFIAVSNKGAQYYGLSCLDVIYAIGYKAVDGRNVQVLVSYNTDRVLRVELVGSFEALEAPPVRLGTIVSDDSCNARYLAMFEASRAPVG